MSTAALRALLSDCDGVIVDSEVVADRAMREVLAGAFGGVDVEPALAGLFGRRVIDIIQLVEQRLERPLTDEHRAALQRDIDARVASLAPAMPGVYEAYAEIGLPLAIVSNSAFDRLHRSVEASGLLLLAGRHVYAAEDVGRPKPAPDAYLHAARQLGVPPAACLVVEDSATGVLAARAAGMAVLGFLGGSHVDADHGRWLTEAGALGLFERMDQLPALVRGWPALAA